MILTISAEHNDARLQGSLNFLHTGGTPVIDFYAGARPSSGGTPSGALIGTIDLPNPCATLTGHALVFVCPQDGVAVSSGTPTWARVRNGGGAHAMDIDVIAVADIGAAGDSYLALSSTTIYAGGTIRLISPSVIG